MRTTTHGAWSKELGAWSILASATPGGKGGKGGYCSAVTAKHCNKSGGTLARGGEEFTFSL